MAVNNVGYDDPPKKKERLWPWDPTSRQYFDTQDVPIIHADGVHARRTASMTSTPFSFGTSNSQGFFSPGMITAQNQAPSPTGQQYDATPLRAPLMTNNGQMTVSDQDPTTLNRTTTMTSSQENTTDPALLQSGIRAGRFHRATNDDEQHETLYPGFRRQLKPRMFFTVGRVFTALWVERTNESTTGVTNVESGTSLGIFGESVFSKVRRFVVIRESDNYCSAVSIVTYGSQGVGKAGVKKSEHAVIHTTKLPPAPLPTELPARGGTGMCLQPIRVVSGDRAEALDPMSRLDFGKVYTIQHDIKVKSFGRVNSESMAALVYQFRSVWDISSRSSSSANTSGHGVSSASRQQQQNANLTSGDLRTQAAAAIERMVGQGSTREEAVRNVKAALRRQRPELFESGSGSEDEDEEEIDDDDDEESGEESDCPQSNRPSNAR